MKPQSVFKSEQGRCAVLAVYGEILKEWPVPYDTREVPTRCGETFVIACGDSALPPLFLIHGSGSNAAMWIGDAAQYSQYFRVYAVDIPGEPGKSRDVRPDLRTDAHAEWLYDVFNALGVSTACLLGISLGGWVALKFAAAHPEMVNKLALLCPAGLGRQRHSPTLMRLLMWLGGKRATEKAMNKIYDNADIPEEAMAYIRLISENFNYYRGAVPRFTDAQLERLTMPVLFIAGENDAMLDTKSAAARVKQHISDAQILLLPGEGHVLIHQQPEIMPFLKG